jgi:hypothetical protein
MYLEELRSKQELRPIILPSSVPEGQVAAMGCINAGYLDVLLFQFLHHLPIDFRYHGLVIYSGFDGVVDLHLDRWTDFPAIGWMS